MRKILKIQIILSFLALFICASYHSFAQETDSIKYSTDTTTVAVKKVKLKGEKISGVILDGNTNKPLNGVRVLVKDFTSKITDDNGKFEIVVPNYKSTLEISFGGYHTKTVHVFKGKKVIVKLYDLSYNSAFQTVNLIGSSSSLDQTTLAVNHVDTKGGWDQDSETINSFLQGKMAGVNIIRRSGTPGIGANLFIRGFNSLTANNQPLYVVDGMVYETGNIGESITYGHINNPLQNIDIKDIKEITVLKDAVGTAIYGTRAANGVILINTVRPDELATKIDFSAYSGINLAPKNAPVMNASNYRSYLYDVLQSQGLSGAAIATLPYMNDNTSSTEYYKYHNETNWQDQVFDQTYDKNYYLKVTGGDNIAKYSLSVGYTNDKGIIKNTDLSRYTARFNSDLTLTKKFTAATSLSLGYSQQDLKDQGLAKVTNPIFLALTKSPFLNPKEVDAFGAISPNFDNADIFGFSNPSGIISTGINAKKAYRFSGTVNFNYQLNKAFKLSNQIGVTYDKAQENYFVPKKGVAVDSIANSLITSRLGTQVVRYFSLYNDTRLSFNKVYNRVNKVQAFGGLRYIHNDSEQDYAMGYNSATDQLISIGNSDVALRTFGGQIGKWANLTSYAAANYAYAEKYIFDVAVSVDGSSRFGTKGNAGIGLSGHRFAVLPAVGAAWILSAEDFMKGVKTLDLLKLRVSYGAVGNDDIGNYSARQSYQSQNLLGIQGLVRSNIANPYIQWEVVKKFNSGIDASFFNERLNLTADFYINNTDKMLTYHTTNTIVGIGSYLSNDGGMKTTGMDLAVNGRVLTGKVKWDAGITVGTYKNEITKLPQTLYTSYAGATYITKVGQAANLFYGQRYTGVYATSTEAGALAIKDIPGNRIPFQGGDAKFVDTDGNGFIEDADRVVIGNPNPDLFGSISNTLSFKNWDFNALLTYSIGNDVYNYTRSQLESGSTYFNQTDILQNRWRGEGQVTNTPRASFGDPMGNARFSDRWIEDGSYLRVRSVSVSYNIPLKPTLVKYAKVYLTGNNLLTFSKYLGYDPEFSAGTGLFSQGIDTTLEPQFRSFQLGVRIGL